MLIDGSRENDYPHRSTDKWVTNQTGEKTKRDDPSTGSANLDEDQLDGLGGIRTRGLYLAKVAIYP